MNSVITILSSLGTTVNGEAHAIRSNSAEAVSRRASPMDITDTDGPVKHGQTEHSEDGTTARESKRIKIEAEDEQEPAQPANGEVEGSENGGEQANDADESAEKSSTQVQDDEDEARALSVQLGLCPTCRDLEHLLTRLVSYIVWRHRYRSKRRNQLLLKSDKD